MADSPRLVRDAPSFRMLANAHAQISQDHGYGDGYVDAADHYLDHGIDFAFPDSARRIFSDGRVLPVYPVFGRRLLRSGVEETAKDEDRAIRRQLRGLFIDEEHEKTNPSSEDENELDGIPPESYCMWTPGSTPRTPDRCTKSSSTGSTMRWRLRDLVGRSHSDGKEKFVFLTAPEKKIKEKSKVGREKKPPTPTPTPAAAFDAGKKGKNVKKETANRGKATDVGNSHRNSNAKGRKPTGGGGRRTFLPYRPEIIGIFAGMNGLSRSYQPY